MAQPSRASSQTMMRIITERIQENWPGGARNIGKAKVMIVAFWEKDEGNSTMCISGNIALKFEITKNIKMFGFRVYLSNIKRI